MRVVKRTAETSCRRCGAKLTWARTEATDLPLRVAAAKQPGLRYEPDIDGQPIPESDGDLAMTGMHRATARGPVPVVRYVRPGSGTHLEHRCG